MGTQLGSILAAKLVTLPLCELTHVQTQLQHFFSPPVYAHSNPKAVTPALPGGAEPAWAHRGAEYLWFWAFSGLGWGPKPLCWPSEAELKFWLVTAKGRF